MFVKPHDGCGHRRGCRTRTFWREIADHGLPQLALPRSGYPIGHRVRQHGHAEAIAQDGDRGHGKCQSQEHAPGHTAATGLEGPAGRQMLKQLTQQPAFSDDHDLDGMAPALDLHGFTRVGSTHEPEFTERPHLRGAVGPCDPQAHRADGHAHRARRRGAGQEMLTGESRCWFRPLAHAKKPRGAGPAAPEAPEPRTAARAGAR